MNDLQPPLTRPESWKLAAGPIAQLLKQVPMPSGAPVLLVLPAGFALETLRTAVTQLGLNGVVMPAHSTQEGVAKVIGQYQPGVVVCPPEVFGWVSKLAFLGGCAAIYTCGEEGEGTLCSRASHCLAVECDDAARATSLWHKRDMHGMPVEGCPPLA
jgi:hypothetical protein